MNFVCRDDLIIDYNFYNPQFLVVDLIKTIKFKNEYLSAYGINIHTYGIGI
jgi:hypothetical protein